MRVVPRRRIAAAAAVGASVALAPHGHVPGTAPLTTLPPPRPFDPHPTSSEASRSAPLVALPAPDASTSTTARTVPLAVRAAGRDLGTFEATCYDLRGRTASGAPAGPGSIAVDPAVIPLGTHLRVGSYQGTADDTGGAIHGRRVDIWSTAAECATFGVRWLEVEAA